MRNLLETIEAYLKANLNVKLVEIIAGITENTLDAGFPAVGICDGGDAPILGKQQSVEHYTVNIPVYSDNLDQREGVFEILDICSEIRERLTDPKNFQETGEFKRFLNCYYRSSTDTKMMVIDEKQFIRFRVMELEFKEVRS